MAELDQEIDAVVVGVDAGVVEWLAAQRPRSATRLLPAVRDRHDVARLVANVRAIRALRADIFQANRRTVMASRFLVVHGRLQRAGEVIHVVAQRFTDLTPRLADLRHGGAATRLQRSRDFH